MRAAELYPLCCAMQLGDTSGAADSTAAATTTVGIHDHPTSFVAESPTIPEELQQVQKCWWTVDMLHMSASGDVACSEFCHISWVCAAQLQMDAESEENVGGVGSGLNVADASAASGGEDATTPDDDATMVSCLPLTSDDQAAERKDS